MVRAHLPDLDALEKLGDKQVKFYAIVGAVVSLTAALEFAFVDIFQKALSLDRALAESLLHPIANTKDRRNLAIKSMEHRLTKEPEATQRQWEKLSARMLTATSWIAANETLSVTILYKADTEAAAHCLGQSGKAP